MDGQTLQQLYSGTNPFLAQMGTQAFQLDQQRKQADLASVLGQEQRAVSNHPLEQQVKQANIDQSKAAAGYNKALAGKLNDELALLEQVPMDQRVAAHVAKMKQGLAGEALKTTDAEMEGLLGAAAAAAQNGGQLPLGYVLQNPQHAEYFSSPQKAQLAMKLAKAYFANKPTELSKEAASVRELAKVRETARLRPAPAPRSNAPRPPKNNLEAVYYYQELSRNTEDPEEAVRFAAMAQEAKKAYEQELLDKARLAAEARLAGGIDMGAATGGQVQTNPIPGRAPSRNAPTLPDGWTVKER